MTPVTTSLLQHDQPLPGRRLSKAEVEDYLEQGAVLHREYSELFFEYLGTAAMNNNLIYQLPNGDLIYAIDPNGLFNPGEGYYYTGDAFLRMVNERRKP